MHRTDPVTAADFHAAGVIAMPKASRIAHLDRPVDRENPPTHCRSRLKLWSIATLWMAQALVAAAQQPAVSLALAPDSRSSVSALGPLHLVGGDDHPVALVLRGTPDARVSLQGRMFQLLSATAVPVSEINWLDQAVIPADGTLAFQPTLSLPETKAITRYLIRFQQPGFSPITVVSYPRDFLQPLVIAAKANPLILIAPPAGIPELLKQRGIATEVRPDASASFQNGSIILSWRALPPSLAMPAESRWIVCDQDEPNREIWQSYPSSSWKVQVSAETCSLVSFQSTAGLAKLLHFTRFIPNH
jgi:hypothetical protein